MKSIHRERSPPQTESAQTYKHRSHRGRAQCEKHASEKLNVKHINIRGDGGKIDISGRQFRSKPPISCKSIAFVDVKTA